jgi:hypothetical protein
MNSPDQPENVPTAHVPAGGPSENAANPKGPATHQNSNAQRNSRLGAALRENLKRRKMQARGRRTEQGTAASTDIIGSDRQD